MPEKTPPTYSWTVSFGDGQGLVVEAAYPVIDDGHMLLKDADHKIVFAAAPQTGCTFAREKPGAPAGPVEAAGDRPAPASFDDLLAAWHKVCVKAWDDAGGHREPTVALPDFLWPHVAAMVNPVTGNLAQIRRVSAFTWGPSHDSERTSQGQADATDVKLGAVSPADVRRMRYSLGGDGDGDAAGVNA